MIARVTARKLRAMAFAVESLIGLNGVWLGYLIAEIISFVIAIIVIKHVTAKEWAIVKIYNILKIIEIIALNSFMLRLTYSKMLTGKKEKEIIWRLK